MPAPIPQVFVGWNVLIVDDEEDNLDVAARLIQKTGANTILAMNGKQGLEALRRERPHFVLCDLSMPIMDGWLFLQAIKEDPDTSLHAIPVVALTAHALPGDKERTERAGFTSYISKPINIITFIDGLIDIMRQVPALRDHINPEVVE
jgi:two-component system, cell cycle response regulator DivK